jgi:hypothetical protein
MRWRAIGSGQECMVMGYGSGKNGFNEWTRAYKAAPSIENYIKLRRENPRAEIEVSILGGMEPLFYMEHELNRYGIDSDLVASVMDSDSEAISEISLQLMERIIEARQLSEAGRSHLAR